ncbi:MAG TPA: F0F1 ATP synthase subunit B [Flavobacteriaceae bacterium]|nr:F0F1 ATP synthase subunit B [Flavobacteriaceae bacterium]
MEKLWNDFSWGLFFWQALILIILVILLRKYAWKPILTSLNDREEKIKDDLESAEKARMEMQNLKADNEALLKEAREERDSMLKEARQMKDKMISEASEEAKQKADKIVADAQVVIQQEKKEALAEIKEQVASLSIEIAEKVIQKELGNKKDQMELVDDMLADVTVN